MEAPRNEQVKKRGQKVPVSDPWPKTTRKRGEASGSISSRRRRGMSWEADEVIDLPSDDEDCSNPALANVRPSFLALLSDVSSLAHSPGFPLLPPVKKKAEQRGRTREPPAPPALLAQDPACSPLPLRLCHQFSKSGDNKADHPSNPAAAIPAGQPFAAMEGPGNEQVKIKGQKFSVSHPRPKTTGERGEASGSIPSRRRRGMSWEADEVIDLSSDDEDCSNPALADVKPSFLALLPDVSSLPHPPGFPLLPPVKEEAEEWGRTREPPAPPARPPAWSLVPPRLCRQFWKSGDYEVGRPSNPAAAIPGGRNRLRINPRFLHSNATSHKWAFGAIAELLDNAIDEIHNGATFVHIDKFMNPRDGSHALLIQDDGGGMDPESLRQCMSFGFSDKRSDAFIGQYGNGFKTSTMRLGADVVVFTKSWKTRTPTKSVGLLSYTFLRETGADDIVVPTVDYQYDLATSCFTQLLRHDQKLFSSNLSIILKWSPFSTEAELLEQFDDMGEHGTKIVVFNLWFNDNGDLELDFNSNEQDILITGAHKEVKIKSAEKMVTQNYVANRFRHSLRAYASILYLHVPENFRIILRRQVVEHHRIVSDVMFRECVKYKPQIAGMPGPEIVTTLGFITGAPNVDVEGFNVYHKNRLISPFWKVASNSYGKGRGVIGVLEANFIKPTHDKQDFEKSTLYQKLETRLKEMTYEYWDLHCQRVGYDNKKLGKQSRIVADTGLTEVETAPLTPPLLLPASSSAVKKEVCCSSPADIPTGSLAIATLEDHAPREGLDSFKSNSQKKIALKRKLDSLDTITGAASKGATDHMHGLENNQKPQRGFKQKRFNEYRTLSIENNKLHEQCLQYEESAKQLVLKERELRAEIADVKRNYCNLLKELTALDVKAEKL